MDPLIYQMALTMVPKIGAITAKKLISYVGSPEGVFREKSAHLKKIPGIGDFLSSSVLEQDFPSMAQKEIEKMKKSGIKYYYYKDKEYPWRLKECEDGPLLLYYKGDTNFNSQKIISIVGTRNASDYGKEVCHKLISELGKKFPELIIISGLAYGIDITAHRAALENKLDTIATLAHGLNTIYPPVHTDVAIKIMNQGALATDFLSYIKPERNNFLRRNRIIAGLSDATLVIESGRKGGSLITAELAESYNREVMAIPGRCSDKYSEGCNYLIKRNIAALCDSSEEIEFLLGWKNSATALQQQLFDPKELRKEEKKILEVIIEEPGLGQEIISSRTNLPIHKLVGILLQMEFRNLIHIMPGNLYKSKIKI